AEHMRPEQQPADQVANDLGQPHRGRDLAHRVGGKDQEAEREQRLGALAFRAERQDRPHRGEQQQEDEQPSHAAPCPVRGSARRRAAPATRPPYAPTSERTTLAEKTSLRNTETIAAVNTTLLRAEPSCRW